jgi:hypothetical protein
MAALAVRDLSMAVFAADGAEERERIARRAEQISAPCTGEEIEKENVVRGYEYERSRFGTFTPDELKALDLESSKVIDLKMFAPRSEVDPVYFNTFYYLYPDGQMAVEVVGVIDAAMAEAGVVGIGRLTLNRRERMVMVEPRGTGMVLITLRAAEEVRAAEFTKADRISRLRVCRVRPAGLSLPRLPGHPAYSGYPGYAYPASGYPGSPMGEWSPEPDTRTGPTKPRNGNPSAPPSEYRHVFGKASSNN